MFEPPPETLIARLIDDAITPERHDPVALEWLRRWSPQRVTFSTPTCTCAGGRCEVCN